MHVLRSFVKFGNYARKLSWLTKAKMLFFLKIHWVFPVPLQKLKYSTFYSASSKCGKLADIFPKLILGNALALKKNNLWKSQILKSTIGQLTILPKIRQIMSNHQFHFYLGENHPSSCNKYLMLNFFPFTLLNVWKKINNCIKF